MQPELGQVYGRAVLVLAEDVIDRGRENNRLHGAEAEQNHRLVDRLDLARAPIHRRISHLEKARGDGGIAEDDLAEIVRRTLR